MFMANAFWVKFNFIGRFFVYAPEKVDEKCIQ